MAIDYQTALSEYGAIAQFAQSNSDINGVLQQAMAGGWDAARFEDAIQQTNWYKTYSDSSRQIQVQAATDPASWNLTLSDKTAEILTQAQGMGKSLTQNQAITLANQALAGNWSSTVLQSQLGALDNTQINGRYTGQAGDVENHIRSTASSFGLPLTDQYVQQQVNSVLAGSQTTGGIDNQLIAQASKLYPQYTEDFTEGRTLSDIAQPFIQQMGQTLEIDPSSVNVTDPTIMKALQGDGTSPTTLYQFTQELKADPRWQKTDNAKNAAYDTLAQIGKDFGFTG